MHFSDTFNIVPINNSLLYVEPVYQVLLNESEIPVLKKVIVASGNTVAIGDNLEAAIGNLFNDDYAVDLEIINQDDINALIDSVIKANNNLKESVNSNNFEMMGKDITSLQTVINQLETARANELKKQAEEEEERQKELEKINTAIDNDVNTIIDNNIENNDIDKNVVLNSVTNTSN